jgi:excisionase family DNA binding protein
MHEQELLTVDQLAERLHVRPRTVKAWALAGRIPAIRVSAKVVRYSWPDVLAALETTPPQTVAAVARKAVSRD